MATVYDQVVHCSEKHVVPIQPKRCSVGYALCGFSYHEHCKFAVLYKGCSKIGREFLMLNTAAF